MIPESPSNRFKRALRKITWPAILLENFAINKYSWLRRSGWVESVRRGYPCKVDGSAIPWMNYSIVEFLEEHLKPEMKVFEFGCGYSTLFFAARVAHVYSVEHDAEWELLVAEHAPANVTCLLRVLDAGNEYPEAILDIDESFDVVVVDGRRRVECLRQSLPRLALGGVLVLDDSRRERYAEGMELARAHGFRELTMTGLKPLGKRPGTTSILYRDENCFGI